MYEFTFSAPQIHNLKHEQLHRLSQYYQILIKFKSKSAHWQRSIITCQEDGTLVVASSLLGCCQIASVEVLPQEAIVHNLHHPITSGWQQHQVNCALVLGLRLVSPFPPCRVPHFSLCEKWPPVLVKVFVCALVCVCVSCYFTKVLFLKRIIKSRSWAEMRFFHSFLSFGVGSCRLALLICRW